MEHKIIYRFDPDIQRAINTDVDERTIRFRITARKVDSHDTVVMPAGLNLDRYKKNPVFLWMHQRYDFGGVYANMDLNSIEQTKEIFDANYYFDVDDPQSAFLLGKYKRGFLHQVSASFKPIRISDEPQFPNQKSITFEEASFSEASSVSVGSLDVATATKRSEYLEEYSDFADQMRKFGAFVPALNPSELPGGEEFMELQRKYDDTLSQLSRYKDIETAYIVLLPEYGAMRLGYEKALNELSQLKK